MKKEIKYTDKFQEVYNCGDKQILIRTFGHVTLGEKNKKVNLLCIAEIEDLDASGIVSLDKLPEQKKPVMLGFSLLPELKHVNKKHIASSIECCGGLGSIIDVYDYMGGLRFEPTKEVWFETNEKALTHILSKEVSDQISGMGMLSGFVMDQYYNRVGETNWFHLEKIMNGK